MSTPAESLLNQKVILVGSGDLVGVDLRVVGVARVPTASGAKTAAMQQNMAKRSTSWHPSKAREMEEDIFGSAL